MHILLPSFLTFAALASGARHGSRNEHPRRLESNDLVANGQVFLSPLDTGNMTTGLVKRSSYNGKGSYYEAGLGACGITSSDSDYIVAINFQQYGDTSAISPWCFKTITITYGGKSAQAEIVDACQACGYGGLDLTPTLFEHFASESVGIIYLEWSSGGSDSTSTTPSSTWQSPTSTWTPTTSAWTPSTTSTTWTPTTTSSVWSSPAASSSVVISSLVSSSVLGSSSALLSSGVLNSTSAALASASAAASLASSTAISPTTTVVASPSENSGGNLDLLQQLVIQMGGLVGATAQNAAS